MDTIGSRIAHIRGDRSQAAFAKELGCHKNTLGNYERGNRSPDADFLVRMARIGVNTHWLVTGEGPRYLADRAQGAHELMVRDVVGGDYNAAQERDRRAKVAGQRVRKVLQEVEAALSELELQLPADRKAELTSVIFEMYMDTDELPRRDLIVRLARSFMGSD